MRYPETAVNGRADAGLPSRDEPVADRLLGDAEVRLRAEVRRIVDREVAPRAAEADRARAFVHESYQALARAGYGGLLFPAELGGSGHSHLGYAVAMEEIASACGATSLVYMTQTHAAYPIYAAGDGEQRRRYIPPLCSGDVYGSLAVTEPGAGSDVASLRTTARREGDTYVLSGTKTFITTGDRADVIVCFATVGGGRRGITAFVVPGDAPGLVRGRTLAKMGMHGSGTAELFFDEVRVPASARLGAEGDGWQIVMASVVKSRISAAAQGVGLASGAYARALAHLRDRGELDRPDTAFRMAELRTRLVQGRLLLYATAAAVDAGEVGTGDIAMMKLAGTDLAMQVATEATEVLGVHGDRVSVGVERYLRDAKVTQIYDGTNEVQRMLVARDTAARLRDGAAPPRVPGPEEPHGTAGQPQKPHESEEESR